MKADFVVDLAWGDCGKGKVVHHLLKPTPAPYTHVVRFAGSGNAGHTIYHNGKKMVTHLIPAGVFFNVKSIVGPGCFVNVKGFFKELEYLEQNDIPASSLVKVAYNAHVITEEHIKEEESESKIGTTRTGNGPCARDKYSRVGIRAESIPELQPYLVDFHDEVFDETQRETLILFEGAQGHNLSVDSKFYPYVTSSYCGVASALLQGIPHTAARDVFGVIKCYDTYVGAMKFEDENDPVYAKIRELGGEVGATTGRPRQVAALSAYFLDRAMKANGVNILIVNKMDVLRELNWWKIKDNMNQIIDLQTEESFKNYLQDLFPEVKIKFSYSPEHI